ncbi:MAG TPA: GntR family transcriptional regulator [Pseudonocardia sp.]
MTTSANGFHVPKYHAITAYLDDLTDTLAEGSPIPPERELAATFGVSRVTVRQAIQELLVAGRLRRQGRGTVVAGPKFRQPLSLASYTEGVRKAGRRPGRSLVSRQQLPADRQLAEALGIDVEEPVIRLERVLLVDDEPLGLEDTYLPHRRFPRLLDEFDPASSLYDYIGRCGIPLARATEHIETVLASPREAKLLNTNPALPMLLLNRVSVDHAGQPVERVRSLFRGDRFSLYATLTADPE